MRDAGPSCSCVVICVFTLGAEAVVGCCTLEGGTLGAEAVVDCCTLKGDTLRVASVGDSCDLGASIPKSVLSRCIALLVAILRLCNSFCIEVRPAVVRLVWRVAGVIVSVKACSYLMSSAPRMFCCPVS